MSWPSLFALLPNCEVECVNINQMVPVILKQASPLPATHPLPPLSTALTLSNHFSSLAFAATSFVLKFCHPKCLPALYPEGWHLLLLPGSPTQPGSPYTQLLLTSSTPNSTRWESSSRAAHQARGPWLSLLFFWTQPVPSCAMGHPAQIMALLPSTERLNAPAHGTKPGLDLVPKPGGEVNVSPVPRLNLRVRTSSTAPAEVLLPSLAYGITQVTIFIFAKAVAMVR